MDPTLSEECNEQGLGGCREIRLSLDIVASSKSWKNIVFHSIRRDQELIDFMYRDSDGCYHAFQVTIGKTHKCNKDAFNKLTRDLDGPCRLYYLVPSDHFSGFTTSPVKPKLEAETYHVMVPEPNKES